MKRILSLAMALALGTSQVFSYTTVDLAKVEAGTAAITTANAMLHAVLPNNPSAGLAQIGELSKEANTLIAYAIQDQSFMVRVARVIDRVAKDASWQKAEAINGAFLKNFSTQLTHGIASEVADHFKGKALAATVPNISDSRIVARAAHALASAVVTSLIETTFHHVDKALDLPSAKKDAKSADVFLGSFFTSLLTEVAYNLAGEAILHGASDAKADLLNDVFSAK